MKIQHSRKNKWLAVLTVAFAITGSLAVATTAPQTAYAETEFKIKEASVAFGDDLALNYFVSVPDDYEISAEYFYKGETFSAEAPTDENGLKKFRFDGITPQNMGEDVTITISVTNNEVEPITYTYSVQKYCMNILEYTAEELGVEEAEMQAMKTLAVDTLNYGAAAQKSTGYETETLVNEDVVDSAYASTFNNEEPKNAYTKLDSNNGALTTELLWQGVRLYFNSYVNIEVAILAAPTQTAEGIKIQYVNQYGAQGLLPVRVETVSMPDKPAGKEEWKWFVARLQKLTSVDFNTVYTFSICNNQGEEWPDAQHLQYSVSTYVARHHDENNNELERAMFLYGKSAFRYKYLDDISEKVAQQTIVKAPTFTEKGTLSEVEHGGYIFVEESELDTLGTADTYSVGEVAYATIENNGVEPTFNNGSVQYTVNVNPAVKFNVAVDHVIKMNGENYTVHNLPENASYDVETDTVTFALNDVNYDNGILVWNKSLTLALTGNNIVTGEAFVNKDRTHTIGGNPNAVEDLPYSIYVKKENGLTKFTGDGTLTVNGMGVRMYTHAEINGATLNVNVAKRVDGTYQGEANDIYSEGFKADGAMTFTNANFTATATTDNVTENMDKSGMVFAGLMLNNSNVTINNFAIGAYMNGGVTVDTTSSFASNNATRSSIAGHVSQFVMQGEANVVLSQQKDGNGLSALDQLHIPHTATARITLLDNDQNPVTLKAEKGVASVTKGDVTNGRVMEFAENNGHNLTLYLTYSSCGFTGSNTGFWDNDQNGIGRECQASFGFYAYQNTEYTSFDYFFFEWFGGDDTVCKSADAYGSSTGVSGEQIGGDGRSVVYATYNDVTFTRANPAGGQGLHMYTWQTLFLGVDMSWMG